MDYVGYTNGEVEKEGFIDSLSYCLCGLEVKSRKGHESCIQSGIFQGKYKTESEWKEFCKQNGRRVAEYYMGAARLAKAKMLNNNRNGEGSNDQE
jgi:hypothetical protein